MSTVIANQHLANLEAEQAVLVSAASHPYQNRCQSTLHLVATILESFFIIGLLRRIFLSSLSWSDIASCCGSDSEQRNPFKNRSSYTDCKVRRKRPDDSLPSSCSCRVGRGWHVASRLQRRGRAFRFESEMLHCATLS